MVALIAANVYWYMQLDKVRKELSTASDSAQARLDKFPVRQCRRGREYRCHRSRKPATAAARAPVARMYLAIAAV